jgi:2-aminoethylphosphonate-pyruvate transaminase
VIVFSPGPANLTDRVRAALLAPAVSHRGAAMKHVLDCVRRDLLAVAGVEPSDWAAVLLGGSGTLAIESCMAALRGRRVLVVSNGPYGERAAALGRYHGALVDAMTLGWGEVISPAQLEAALSRSRPAHLYLVHHETATGRLNELEPLARVAGAHGIPILVDATSSLAGEALPLEEWGIDAVLGSSSKCLRAVPGVAFVLARRHFLEAAREVEGLHYSHLGQHFQAGERGVTPFTPPVHALFALQAALAELLEEGVPARLRHYVAVSARLREGLAALGIEPLLQDGPLASTMVACRLPHGVSFDALSTALEARGFAIYGAQGALEGTVFRLGLVGAFGLPEVEAFLIALRHALAELRS